MKGTRGGWGGRSHKKMEEEECCPSNQIREDSDLWFVKIIVWLIEWVSDNVVRLWTPRRDNLIKSDALY